MGESAKNAVSLDQKYITSSSDLRVAGTYLKMLNFGALIVIKGDTPNVR